MSVWSFPVIMKVVKVLDLRHTKGNDQPPNDGQLGMQRERPLGGQNMSATVTR